MISVENAVTARFPDFPQRNPAVYKTVVAILRFLFREVEFRRFAERYPHLTGFDFVEQGLDHFDFGITVSDRERERIPAWGRVVIVANHPIGSLDGLALLNLVGKVRRDVKVVANEVLSAVAPLQNLLLPVDAFGSRSTRDNLRAIEQHLQNDGAVIIFPAGEVSRMGATGVKDGAWRHGFLRFATKTKAPILPMFVDARNSIFFYSLSFFAKPLSTLWLVREMFKHNNKNMRVRIGQAIDYETYSTLPLDSRAKVKLFRRHIYKIGKNRGEGCFETAAESIAHPEDRQQLRAEIRACELLGTTHTGTGKEGMAIYLYRFDGDSSVMREIARLREVSFRAVGEGSGRRRDMDMYDRDYDHIVLWDDEALELVGAYRLRRTADLSTGNTKKLYSDTLFEYRAEAQFYFAEGVELGRSFVQPRYQGLRALEYLWQGIGAYLRSRPGIRYLFGPVSLSGAYPEYARRMLVYFFARHFGDGGRLARGRRPYAPGAAEAQAYAKLFGTTGYEAGLEILRRELASIGMPVPVLFKQYAELCEPGGTRFLDFSLDPAFGNCVDGLVLVDVQKLKPAKRQRYVERGSPSR